MNTTRENQTDLEKRTYSNADRSGTNSDRYASHHTVAEAEIISQSKTKDYCESLIPGLPANVSKLERMLMVAAGSYLIYNALSSKKKNVGQTIAGGALLVRGISGYCPVYDAMGKIESKIITINTAIHIDKPVNEVYDFWRNLENLPKFMSHLESVVAKNESHSHWIAKGPLGIGTVSWDAKIVKEEQGRILSWQSLPSSTVENSGEVVFRANEDGGTKLKVTISYKAPVGAAGEVAVKLLNPVFEKLVKSDIESLKLFLENKGKDAIV